MANGDSGSGAGLAIGLLGAATLVGVGIYAATRPAAGATLAAPAGSGSGAAQLGGFGSVEQAVQLVGALPRSEFVRFHWLLRESDLDIRPEHLERVAAARSEAGIAPNDAAGFQRLLAQRFPELLQAED